MSQALDSLALTALLAMPTATSLSQCKSVGGWGYPKSARVWRLVMAILAAPKVPAHSASCTLEHTTGIRVGDGDPRWWKSHNAARVRTQKV
jgi:hypothetical protein